MVECSPSRSLPNYEDPHSVVEGGTRADKNVYNVTIEATGGMHDVAVTVTDVDEAGKVTWTSRSRRLARGLEATCPKMMMVRRMRCGSGRGLKTVRLWTDIEGAHGAVPNPATADVGSTCERRLTYADSFGAGKTASAVS